MDLPGLCHGGTQWGRFKVGEEDGTGNFMLNVVDLPVENIRGKALWVRDVNSGLETPKKIIGRNAAWETNGCSSRIMLDDGSTFVFTDGRLTSAGYSPVTWRGLCIHPPHVEYSGGWNCDGDGGQSDGFGLFGGYAGEVPCTSGPPCSRPMDCDLLRFKIHEGTGNADKCYSSSASLFELRIDGTSGTC
jgi:hypothetical protein